MKYDRIVKSGIAGLAAVLMVSSCLDLKENPYTFMDPYSYYRTEEHIETAMTAVYAGFGDLFGSWDPLYAYELVTSHAMPAHASKSNVKGFNCWQGVNQETTYNINIWDKGYDLINRCNVVIGRAAKVEMPEESRDNFYGQARFIRAYTMFTLLRLYGGLAIPESYTSSLEGLEIPRESVSDTYDYIIADLEYAAEVLPARSEWGADAYYKISSGAAMALLGDVWLTRACMNDYNTEYLTNAKEWLGKVISSKEYELLKDYKSLWYWFVEESSKNTRESLLEIQFGASSDNIYNSLHCYFGINITDESLGAPMYARAGLSHKDYLSYSDNDVRKQCFITEFTATTGIHYFWEPENKGYSGQGEGMWPTTSPGNVKFYDRTASSFETGTAKNNFILIRYSDVLLNYAEAENLLNGPTADAYEKLNLVHDRSVPSEPIPAGLSKEEFDEVLYQERVWEEIGEGLLYFDELRTDRLGKTVWEYKTYMYENGYYNCEKLQFVPQRDFLWKINKTSLDSNPALVQNPDNVSDPRYPLD